MKKSIAALALIFALTTGALAQWQVPDHAVPIGNGAGVTGFNSAAPGTSGQPFISNGASSDPSFAALPNGGLATMPTNTVKCNSTGSSAAPQDCVGFRWGPTSIGVPTLTSGELYYDNMNAYSEHNAPFNLTVDWGASAPSGAMMSGFIFNQCQGNNSTFVGCMGLYIQTRDRPSVTGANKGVLYGINIDIFPTVARNNSPADDADGIGINNLGSARASEGIFMGHNGSLSGGDWGTVLGLDAWADMGMRLSGHYNYGISFASGGVNASFINSGGAILLPASGTVPFLAVGTDPITPTNNKNAISVDANAQVLFVGAGAYFSFGNNAQYVYTQSNTNGTFPISSQGFAFGGNFSSGSSEIDFFNTITAATESFRFYQKTGASAATLLATLLPTGHGVFAGYVKTGVTVVASLPTCNAGSEGARHYVTDQNTAVAYRGAVTGGGATRQAVLCSNSAWIQD